MSRQPVILRILILVVLAIFLAGCTAPAPVPGTGSLELTSSPPGAEVYMDGEYRGITPAAIAEVPAGSHNVEVLLAGYERWSSPVTVTKDGAATLTAMLVSIPATLPVTVVTTTGPKAVAGAPQIHVDGYWTFPPGGDSQTNPVPLLVHTEAFNVGSTDARVVTVSATFWYENRQVCWNTIYLGTLNAGSHVARDSMVTCTLPSPFTSADLTVGFTNLVVTP
jgi:hypothetical protein